MKRAAAASVALAIVLAVAACGGSAVASKNPLLTVPGVVGSAIQLEIVDETGELADAHALAGEELAGLPLTGGQLITAEAGSTPNEVRLEWISFSCETSGRLTISRPNKVSVVSDPTAPCADAGIHRGVILVFRGPVNAPALQVELQPFTFEEKG